MKRLKPHIRYGLLILALAAFAFFFPLKYSSGHTCFGERLFTPVSTMGRHTVDAMIHHYLFPYGVIWWVSVAALIFIIFNHNNRS